MSPLVRIAQLLFVFALLALAVPCIAGNGTGTWGGRGVQVTISPDSARFEFQCAHGAIAASDVRKFLGARHFDVLGNYIGVRTSGLRTDEVLPLKIVHYKGGFAGNRLTFAIVEAKSHQAFGQYSAVRGASIALQKC